MFTVADAFRVNVNLAAARRLETIVSQLQHHQPHKLYCTPVPPAPPSSLPHLRLPHSGVFELYKEAFGAT